MKNEKKKEMASKMYSVHRCGKCNRFGHSHEKCTYDSLSHLKNDKTGKYDLKLHSKARLAKDLDSFISKNEGAGKQTNRLSQVHYSMANEN